MRYKYQICAHIAVLLRKRQRAWEGALSKVLDLQQAQRGDIIASYIARCTLDFVQFSCRGAKSFGETEKVSSWNEKQIGPVRG
jgi:hypothetical protein